MRFISIDTKWLGTIAINANNIDSIQAGQENEIYFYMSGGKPILTLFTSIEHAVDYLQRASSISLEEVA